MWTEAKPKAGDMKRFIRTGSDPVLKRICLPVEPGEPLPFLDLFKRVCRDVRDPAAAGLAAPQIGVPKRIIITNLSRPTTFHGKPVKSPPVLRVMINPVIVYRSPGTEIQEEGCLSYPNRFKAIERPIAIRVEWQDEKRVPRSTDFDGFEARVIQHEVDHLNGVCRVGDDSPPDSAAPDPA